MPSIFNIRNLKVVATITVFLFGFLNFYHPDLVATVLYAQDFNLDNFYQLCAGNCTYLPLTYAIFYLWSWPAKFIFEPSLVDPEALMIGLQSEPGFFLFHKLLLALLFFLSVFLIKKIEARVGIKNKHAAKLFLFSPFCFFAIFFFAGYDIFTVCLCLLAFLLYLKNRIYWCFLIFSISLSFKFFSILFALSLLAWASIKLYKKAILFILLCSAPIFQFVLFHHDSFFMSSVLSLVYRNSGNLNLSFSPAMIVAGSFFVWLCFLQFNNRFKLFFQDSNIVYLPYVSFLFLFFYSPMQPQWIILVLPFMYLIISKTNTPGQFSMTELLFFILFVLSVTNIWAYNVDLNLSNGSFFEGMRDLQYQFKNYYVDLHNSKYLFLLCYGSFYLFFLTPLVFTQHNIVRWLKFCKFNISTLQRFYIGAAIIFSPFLLASHDISFVSLDASTKSLNKTKKLYPLNLRNSVEYGLKSREEICDEFKTNFDGLTFINLRWDTIYFENPQAFKFSIEGSERRVFKKFITDNKSLYFELPFHLDQNEPFKFCIANTSNALKYIRLKENKQENLFNLSFSFIKQ